MQKLLDKIHIPDPIAHALEQNAVVVISISGGKDSQALLRLIPRLLHREGYTNRIVAVHAHLGRMEWPQTLDHCRKICDRENIELVVVQREKGDLLDRWRERMATLAGTGKPFWSSAMNRYCTSDLKRGPINKFLRQWKDGHVISVEGIRAEESPARARKAEWEFRMAITTKTRTAYTWNPILHFTLEDVLMSDSNTIGTLDFVRKWYNLTGEVPEYWPFHPAYAMGNDRLSCCICILGSVADIKNGIKHNPEIATELIQMERESGFSFRHKQSLEGLREEMIKEVAV